MRSSAVKGGRLPQEVAGDPCSASPTIENWKSRQGLSAKTPALENNVSDSTSMCRVPLRPGYRLG
ncbi:MAG: hypothetical protein FWE94_01885 [Coriobacteriia bacterium]|nr:hypothetical protein [Coriobacteriia bacterium]